MSFMVDEEARATINRLDDTISVCGQISVKQVEWIAKQGYGSLLCNRPDGEATGQPSHVEIEVAARAAGLDFYYLPISTRSLDSDSIKSFGIIYGRLPKPILAYCFTGTRSAILWALSRAGEGEDRDQIIQKAKSAGYNISYLFQD